MKSEKENEKVISFKNKTELIRTFIFMLCFIFILLLVYVVGTLLYMRSSYQNGYTTEMANDEYFENCELLADVCTNIDCEYYSYCGDESYEVCRVYDCDDTYGIFTENGKGVVNTKNEPKPDIVAISEQKKACNGSMQLLSEDCVDGKDVLKVEIKTEGECEIGGFTVIYEKIGARNNEFTALGDGLYTVTADTCGDLVKITPATKNGISLNF